MHWKVRVKGQHQKNKSDRKQVGRRTIQKQDRSMWSFWEESHGQLGVVHKMWKLGSWQSAKIKRVTARLATHFVCLKCKGIIEGTVDSIDKLCDEVETVNGVIIWETD